MRLHPGWRALYPVALTLPQMPNTKCNGSLLEIKKERRKWWTPVISALKD